MDTFPEDRARKAHRISSRRHLDINHELRDINHELREHFMQDEVLCDDPISKEDLFSAQDEEE